MVPNVLLEEVSTSTRPLSTLAHLKDVLPLTASIVDQRCRFRPYSVIYCTRYARLDQFHLPIR